MIKIVARMRGGLGNQLFILSFAYRLLIEAKQDEYEIVLDNREYKKYKIRSLEINKLICDKNVRLFNQKKDYSFFYDFTRWVYHIFQFVFKSAVIRKKVFYFLSKFGLYYSDSSIGTFCSPIKKKKIYLYGYFQNASSVVSCLPFFKKQIGFCDNDDRLNSQISISIRCGADYIKGGWKICTTNYYKKALEYILSKKKVDARRTKIIVFSDDIAIARTIIDFSNAVFIENLEPIDQLKLMSKSSDFIISNSSFSWWGSLLGKSEKTIIVAPYVWHDSGVNIYDSSLFIDCMHVLPND